MTETDTPPRNPLAIGRSMPHSVEAEEYLISCCLLDGPEVISRCMEARIRKESFYVEAHGTIFERLMDLYNRQVPIDVGTLAEDLRTVKLLDSVGGYAFLTQVSSRIPTTAQAGFYIEKVRELALLRDIIRAGTGAVESCFEFSGGIDEFVDQVEQKIFAVTQARVSESAKQMREPTQEAMKVINKMMMKKGELTGVATGFKDLDALTWGFQRQEMIILAARPSMGKCLSRDSEIVIGDGSIATIEEIFARKAAQMLTLGSDQRLTRTVPSDFVDDGIKPVFRIRTRSGRKIEATGPHPFLTQEGWRPVLDLHVGMPVAVPCQIPVFGTAERPLSEISVAATLCANRTRASAYRVLAGRASRARRVQLVGSRQLDDADVTRQTFAGRDNRVRSRLSQWIGQVAYRAGSSRDLGLPAFAFTLKRNQLAIFLNRFFNASEAEVTTDAVVLRASSEVVVRQVAHLLLRFGILSDLGKDCRSLGVTDPESLISFAKEIGIEGQSEAVRRLGERVLQTFSPSMRRQSDIVWDEIVSIESAGNKQVYDLTIPETHNFVANDICVHNTSLALNFAEGAAMPRRGEGQGVLIFSLEMSAAQLAMRMLCSRARVNMKLLRDGLLSKNGDEQQRMVQTADEFAKAPIYIDDSSNLSIMQLRAKARRLHARHKLGFIIVDYLQLLSPTDPKVPREQQVAEASRGLKALSKELDLPVLVLSQLNRSSEKENRTPKLADLRESGSIEQDADVVLMLARPKDADEKFQVAADSAELIVAKQRNGPVGDLKLTFLRDITRFENYTQ